MTASEASLQKKPLHKLFSTIQNPCNFAVVTIALGFSLIEKHCNLVLNVQY